MFIVHNKKIFSISEYQKIKGLSGYKIAKYISIKEFPHSATSYIHSSVLDFFDYIRENYGKPLKINSFVRNNSQQRILKNKGYRTAENSPHVSDICIIRYCCAIDIDTVSDKMTDELVKIAKNYERDFRLGYVLYKKNKQTFLHIDTAPEVYQNRDDVPMQWKISGLIW